MYLCMYVYMYIYIHIFVYMAFTTEGFVVVAMESCSL